MKLKLIKGFELNDDDRSATIVDTSARGFKTIYAKCVKLLKKAKRNADNARRWNIYPVDSVAFLTIDSEGEFTGWLQDHGSPASKDHLARWGFYQIKKYDEKGYYLFDWA